MRIVAVLILAGWLASCATVGAIIGTATLVYGDIKAACAAADVVQDLLQDAKITNSVVTKLETVSDTACSFVGVAPAGVQADLEAAIADAEALLQ
jgi:hypothetical protein